MKSFFKIFSILFVAAALQSCKEDDHYHDPNPALFVAGKEVMRFDEKKWQAVCFSQENTFVMTTDEGDCWYRLECNEFPSERGQRIRTNLSWQTPGGSRMSRRGITLRVSLIDSETGKVNMWDSESKISVSIICIR